jgi:hypothetical protein
VLIDRVLVGGEEPAVEAVLRAHVPDTGIARHPVDRLDVDRLLDQPAARVTDALIGERHIVRSDQVSRRERVSRVVFLKYVVESLTIVLESYASTIATVRPLPMLTDFTP